LYREDYKGHLEAFIDRMERRWPGAAVIWKLEFQERKSGQKKGKIAPHYHLFIYGVPWQFPYKKERGRFFKLWRSFAGVNCEHWTTSIETSDGQMQVLEYSLVAEPYGREGFDGRVFLADSLKAWSSRNWFDVVGSDNLAHFKAGTRVERLKTIKGAFAYAGKRYIAKKENIPEMAQKPGRFWGVVGRKNLPLGKRDEREVSAKQAMQLRRLIRRYRWANTPLGKRKYLRKSQLWSQEFTAKLFCDVETWVGRYLF
jgi:hypothetical protein